MIRLTHRKKEYNNEYFTSFEDNGTTCHDWNSNEYGGGKLLTKLGQLEDIEEELGIDLVTLIKAQTQGFYIINGLDEIEKAILSEWRFNLTKKEVHRDKWSKHLSFVDYGRTWALTKEELLEN